MSDVVTVEDVCGDTLGDKMLLEFHGVVDLPAPERPVNQTVQPLKPLVPRALDRSSLLTWLEWMVTFVAFISVDIFE